MCSPHADQVFISQNHLSLEMKILLKFQIIEKVLSLLKYAQKRIRNNKCNEA